jgi:hypothetical protein
MTEIGRKIIEIAISGSDIPLPFNDIPLSLVNFPGVGIKNGLFCCKMDNNDKIAWSRGHNLVMCRLNRCMRLAETFCRVIIASRDFPAFAPNSLKTSGLGWKRGFGLV